MYIDCFFFAEKTSAHKGAKLAGTVLVVAKRPERNGECVAAVGMPRGVDTVPVKTWASLAYLTRSCVQVSEVQARSLTPRMFAALEAYDRAPEYRAGHVFAVVEAIKRGAYTLQPADASIIAGLDVTRPVETRDGFEHRRRTRAA